MKKICLQFVIFMIIFRVVNCSEPHVVNCSEPHVKMFIAEQASAAPQPPAKQQDISSLAATNAAGTTYPTFESQNRLLKGIEEDITRHTYKSKQFDHHNLEARSHDHKIVLTPRSKAIIDDECI